MADANAVPSQPVILSNPAPVSQTPTQPAAPQQQPQGQGEVVQLGNFDPNKLSPEMREQYNSLYGDYQKKTTAIADERRGFESKYSDLEKKFSNLEKQIQNYQSQEQIWRQWAPMINGLNQRGRFELAQRIANGEDIFATAAAAAKPEQKANAALERLINMGDDEYVTGGQLNQYLGEILNKAVTSAVDKAKEGWQNYGQQAGREILQQVFGVNQDYFKLFDQMFNLKLQKLYNLQPQENALFDEQRIIDEANRLNLRDLNMVWQMLYGDQRAQQAVQMAQQGTQAEVEKKLKEAYERGIQEERLRLHNAENPMIGNNGTPLPQFNGNGARPVGYAQAEQGLKEALAKLGMRQ